MQYFQIVFRAPFKGIFFLLLSFILIFSVGHHRVIEKKFLNSLPDDRAGAYFHALVSNKINVEEVRRKVRGLPGVYTVEIMKKDSIAKKVKKQMQSFKLEGTEEMDLDYSGMKVVFGKGLQERSKKMIREYLLRFAGDKNISLSATKNLSAKKSSSQLISFLKRWSVVSLVVVSVILWLCASVLIFKESKKRAYIIQQFQRRTRVAFKIIFSGNILVTMFCGVIAVVIPGVDSELLLVAMVVMILSSTLFIKRPEWER